MRQISHMKICHWLCHAECFTLSSTALTGTARAFGLIGNSLSLAVLHKYTRGNVGTYLLKALAITDNLYLANVIGGQMYVAGAVSYDMWRKIKLIVRKQMHTYSWPQDHIAVTWSVGMIVLVAGNRYMAVCRPMMAPRLCTMNKVQLVHGKRCGDHNCNF